LRLEVVENAIVEKEENIAKVRFVEYYTKNQGAPWRI
jgi:hypothetical protein